MPRPHSVQDARTTATDRDAGPPRLFRRVMACLDHSREAAAILRQASEVARAFSADLTALRVLPGPPRAASPVDPVDWALRSRTEIADIERLAEDSGGAEGFETVLDCGPVVASVLEQASRVDADLLVAGLGQSGVPGQHGVGGHVRRLVEDFPGSLYLIPETAVGEPAPNARLVLPVDGSSQAEAALAYACELARQKDLELVILHASPPAAPDPGAQPEPGDRTLFDELDQREKRRSGRILRRMSRLVLARGLRSRLRHLEGEEPRRALMRAICEERPEVVVLSARGLGADPDLPVGSTADYLITHAVTPILLTRHPEASGHRLGGDAPRRRTPAVERRW